MMLKIQNIARRPLSVTGNSGQTWHLAPGGSTLVAEAEVKDSAKINKLVAARLLAMIAADGERHAGDADKDKSRKSKSTR